MKKTLYVAMLGLLAFLPVTAQVDITSKPQLESIEDMLDFSITLLRRPYRAGGLGPYAFDCSGFTRHCYGKLGINLHHNSKMQSTQGKKIRSAKHLKPGDLVFYKGSSSKSIGHVGIVTEVNDGQFKFIHASTSKGVIISDSEQKYYADRFVGGSRVTKNKYIKKAIKSFNGEDPGDEEPEATEEVKRNEETPQRNEKEQRTVEKQDKKEQKTEVKEKEEETPQKKDSDTDDKKKETQNSEQGVRTLSGTTYTVKAGDTLYNVARRAGTTVDSIKTWNNLKSDNLHVGQKLIIREK